MNKRGRKPSNPVILKKKPSNAFLIKDHFKTGFQSDARKLAKPKDSLVNYRCVVSDKKWITLTNNEYEYNDETQEVIVFIYVVNVPKNLVGVGEILHLASSTF